MFTQILQTINSYGYAPRKILDIGANKGNWTKEVKCIFPNASYTLIEPTNYDELKNSPDKVIYELLSNSSKIVEWYQNKSTGDSMFKENTGFYANCKPLMKQTTTLDELFKNNEQFDLIKIDVQGAEIPVLEGGLNLIKNTSFIVLELPFIGQYNSGVPDFLTHIKFMDSVGFIVYDISEIHKIFQFCIQVDIVFVNKNHEINKVVQHNINSFR